MAEETAVQAHHFYIAECVQPTLSNSDESLANTRQDFYPIGATTVSLDVKAVKGVGWKGYFSQPLERLRAQIKNEWSSLLSLSSADLSGRQTPLLAACSVCAPIACTRL